MANESKSADVIIVGGGSAGAVLANRPRARIARGALFCWKPATPTHLRTIRT
jgi:glycerol-3-phosphate dehydrogenase